MATIRLKLNEVKCPLDFLANRYRQDKFFDDHELAVLPETVNFGTELSSYAGRSKIVYESFQYVSVQKTVRSLMSNKAFVEMLLNDKCNNDVLQEFTDGEKCKIHPLFSDSSKMSIMIQLFYDGLGVTNPLRGQSVLHNVGVFLHYQKSSKSLQFMLFKCAFVGHLLFTRFKKIWL